MEKGGGREYERRYVKWIGAKHAMNAKGTSTGTVLENISPFACASASLPAMRESPDQGSTVGPGSRWKTSRSHKLSYRLYPISKEVNDDEFEVVGYEIH